MVTAYAEHIREVALKLDKIRIQCPEDYDHIKDVVADLLRAEEEATDDNSRSQGEIGYK